MSAVGFVIDGASFTDKSIQSVAAALHLCKGNLEGSAMYVALAAQNMNELDLAAPLSEHVLGWHKKTHTCNKDPLSPHQEISFSSSVIIGENDYLYTHGTAAFRLNNRNLSHVPPLTAENFNTLQIGHLTDVSDKMKAFFDKIDICIISNGNSSYSAIKISEAMTSAGGSSCTIWLYLHMQKVLFRTAKRSSPVPGEETVSASRRLLKYEEDDANYDSLLTVILQQADMISHEWTGGKKAQKIYDALIHAPLNYTELRNAILNPEHALYQALNHQRGVFTGTAMITFRRSLTDTLAIVQTKIGSIDKQPAAVLMPC